MVSNDIFYAFLVSNLEIKFLKKDDLMNESGLDLFLHHEVPKRRMIGENGGFGPKQVGMKVLSCKHHLQ